MALGWYCRWKLSDIPILEFPQKRIFKGSFPGMGKPIENRARRCPPEHKIWKRHTMPNLHLESTARTVHTRVVSHISHEFAFCQTRYHSLLRRCKRTTVNYGSANGPGPDVLRRAFGFAATGGGDLAFFGDLGSPGDFTMTSGTTGDMRPAGGGASRSSEIRSARGGEMAGA